MATRFRRFNRGLALATLALVALAMLALVAASLDATEPAAATSAQMGDLALYGRIVARLRHGEDYYVAAHVELMAGHYPTLSVFNWRTPLLLGAVSLAPGLVWAQGVFALLAVLAGALAVFMASRQGNWIVAGAGAPLLILSLGGVLVPGTVYFGEIVAGILILGSCCCYGLRLWLPGLLLAVLALFVRELAAPFMAICLGLALLEGRRREFWLGLLGVAGFGAYYLLHMHAIEAQLGPADFGDPQGWISFGGLGFVVRTAAFNGFLMMLPLWVSAMVLPLAVLGLLALPAGGRMALVVAAYVLVFSIAGKPFDDYWGGLYTPLLALGVVWAPLGLRDLLGTAIPAAGFRWSRRSSAAPADAPPSGS